MTREHSGRPWVAGALLIALGVMLLLGRLNLPGDWHMHGIWPVILIVIGVAKFLGADARRRAGSGLGLVFAGIIFLLHTQGVVRLDDSWPLFVVAGGVSILFGGWSRRPPGQEERS